MIPQAVLVESVGEGGGKRSLARSLHIYKLAFQSCRYVATRAENIHVSFFPPLIQDTKNKQNIGHCQKKQLRIQFTFCLVLFGIK